MCPKAVNQKLEIRKINHSKSVIESLECRLTGKAITVTQTLHSKRNFS